MNISTLGIDLAKNVFQICAANQHGKTIFNRTVQRKKLIEFIAQMPPCIIGMESCNSAHYWARTFERLGHTVRLIAPQYVTPYRQGLKNDANGCGCNL